MGCSIRLADLVRQAVGWPIDLKAAAAILDRAEEILPGGIACREPLTPEQLTALGFKTFDELARSKKP